LDEESFHALLETVVLLGKTNHSSNRRTDKKYFSGLKEQQSLEIEIFVICETASVSPMLDYAQKILARGDTTEV
jgi:hypothetical protein